jgi:HrpA-like RNA helicase
MSATMDVDHIRGYFTPKVMKATPVPCVWVEGRVHDVEIKHITKHHDDYLAASLSTLFLIHKSAPTK